MKNYIKDNFSIISNKLINDNRITAGAKGIACYLLSKPDDWVFFMEEISKNFKDSFYAVKKYIKELENIGFLKRTRISKKENGRNSFVWKYDFCIDYICINTNCIDANCIDAKASDILILTNTNTNITNTDYIKENIKEISKTKSKQLDLSFIDNPEYKDLISLWVEYKRERKEKYKSIKSLELVFKNLLRNSNNDILIAKQIINQSIENNWSGLFPLKETFKTEEKIQETGIRKIKSLKEFKDWWIWWGKNDDTDIDGFMIKYDISGNELEEVYDTFINYCEDNDKKYEDYKTTYKSFLLNSLKRRDNKRSEY